MQFSETEEEEENGFYDLFMEDFFQNDHPQRDDLLFFVKRYPDTENASGDEKRPKFIVLRRDSGKELPSKDDRTINWKQTFYLNTITQHFSYTLVMEISHRKGTTLPSSATRGDTNSGRYKRKVECCVWASPSKVRMDAKGEEAEETYPFIFFGVNDFQDVLEELVVNAENQLVCVKLMATGELSSHSKRFGPKAKSTPIVIFSGAVGYSVVEQAYNAQISKRQGSWNWRTAASAWTTPQAKTDVFLDLKGPGGKGKAQMAVTPYKEPEPSASIISSWGGSVISSAMKKMATTKTATSSSSSLPVFSCSITYIILPWESIIQDMAQPYLQNVHNTEGEK